MNKWHTYTLEWTPKHIIGFVDEKPYFKYEKPTKNANEKNWPYDNEFKMIINSAVGGNWGGANGVDETIFPQKFIIDYVKVWNLPNTK